VLDLQIGVFNFNKLCDLRQIYLCDQCTEVRTIVYRLKWCSRLLSSRRLLPTSNRIHV